MTLIEESYSLEWNDQLPLFRKLEILKQYFNVDSLTKISFWDLYRAIRKFNSI